MFDAQLLLTDFNGETHTPIQVYSPWLPRQADNVRFTGELVATDNGKLTVVVFHKNTEDPGDGTEIPGVQIQLTTASRSIVEWTGLEELVRYRFEVAANDPLILSPAWVLFRMLAPQWFDTVDATSGVPGGTG